MKNKTANALIFFGVSYVPFYVLSYVLINSLLLNLVSVWILF